MRRSSRELRVLKIQLLGDFRVITGSRTIERAAWRLRKAGHIVKLLALAPNHRLHREKLLDLLWPELPPGSAANNLRVTLHDARRTLAPELPASAIELQHEWFVLSPSSPPDVDVTRFEDAAAQAQSHEDPDRYRTAVDLYSGDLLPDDPYEDWAVERRDALRITYLRLLVQLGQQLEERGDYAGAIATYGQALTTDNTAEAAHRGLMRSYAATGARADALRQFRQAEAILKAEIDAAPTEETIALFNDIQSGATVSPPQSEPPLRVTTVQTHGIGNGADQQRLPEQRTSFVGREAELAAIPRRLEESRLLTLTGAGGIGKTRLALRAASVIQADYDRIWFVEIAGIQRPDLVAEAVATALGVHEQPGLPALERVATTIGETSTLLILDNCEHLVDACARLADGLLHRCLNLNLLATSRQPLGVPGESVIRVPPMDIPTTGGDGTLIEEVDAVRLFLARARLSNPAFEFENHKAATITAICRAMDGVPLALELAAARVHALGLDQLAARMGDTLGVLNAGPRTVDRRHQSLRAALDWSHALLNEDEQRILRRLAVFAGGWPLDAAEAVCRSDEDGCDAVMDSLFQLIDKSLVLVEESGDLVRYRMLEPVRQYATHRLVAAGERTWARTRHLGWCMGLTRQAECEMSGEAQHFWLERLEVEHDNLRAALDWSHYAGDRETGLQLATALWRFWELRGHSSEGQGWLERLLAGNGEASAKVRAGAFNAAGNLASNQGRYAESDRFYEQSLALAREIGDRPGIARVLNNLANNAAEQGRFQDAIDLYRESLGLSRDMGLDWNIANTLNNLAIVLQHRGDYRQATALLEEALDIWRALGERSSYAQSLDVLGEVAREQGDYRLSTERHTLSLAIRREIGDRRRVAVSLQNLGLVALLQQDDERVTELACEALQLQRALGDPRGEAGSLVLLGHVALMQGDHLLADRRFKQALTLRHKINSREDVSAILIGLAAASNAGPDHAAWLLGAAAALRESLETPLDRFNDDFNAKAVKQIRKAMDSASFDDAWSSGARLPIERVIDIVLRENLPGLRA